MQRVRTVPDILSKALDFRSEPILTDPHPPASLFPVLLESLRKNPNPVRLDGALSGTLSECLYYQWIKVMKSQPEKGH